LSEIQGLDVTMGLRSLRGNQKAYLRLLGMLVEHHQADGQQMSEYLAAGNWTQVGQIAHTLKGAAGSLGAMRIRELADVLNTAIRRGADTEEIKAHSEALIVELPAFITAVKSVIA
jgi:HPt (histidine-containing phosphotransfer) domain-containing protein